MRADFRADAVLERRDDLAARRVVLGVGGECDQDVQRQPHRVALNLHVAFLQDVEQADLDLAGQVGQLVDGEDAAIGARQQAEVDRQLVAELQAALGRLDRIDVADHVGDGDVRRRQLFDVARFARQPADRHLVAFGLDAVLAERRQRRNRIVVDLALRNHRQPLVQQRGQGAEDARLGLAAQAEQDEMVARQDRVDQLRHDGVVVADDARKQRVFPAQSLRQVVADLVTDRPAAHLTARDGGLQLSERIDAWRGRHISIMTLETDVRL